MHSNTRGDKISEPGYLAQNVAHFARALRLAGVPVGPDRVLDALRALEATGISRRDDFYWTLAALFLNRREHFDVFDQAFNLFWRNRQLREQLPPSSDSQTTEHTDEDVPGHRVAEALGEDVREEARTQAALLDHAIGAGGCAQRLSAAAAGVLRALDLVHDGRLDALELDRGLDPDVVELVAARAGELFALQLVP